MYLPNYVKACIDSLESAGFSAYAVGGCVRDTLLGQTPHDYDLCTGAAPEQIRSVFSGYPLILSGEKHGTVTVIMDGEPVEITTYRQEGGYEDNRHPSWVRFVSDVETDLSRRDFTVNAMAYSPYRGFCDPFGGQTDLKNHCLRAVGDAAARFREDSLRILRGVRFSVRYGLTPEQETLAAMHDLAPLMDRLARERVFDELCKLLPLVTAADLIRFSPILCQVIPELAPLPGFDQHSPYHAFDLFIHTAQVTEGISKDPALRWAALLHDIGKPASFYIGDDGRGHFPNHAALSAEMADTVLRRLKAPNALRERVTALVRRHMTLLEPDKKLLRRRLGKYGVQGTLDLLELQRADFYGKGTETINDCFDRIAGLISQILEEHACLTVSDLAINGQDLISAGMKPGPRFSKCLNALLTMVQDDLIPNTREALLKAVSELPES